MAPIVSTAPGIRFQPPQIYGFQVIITFYNEKCGYLTVNMVINAFPPVNEK